MGTSGSKDSYRGPASAFNDFSDDALQFIPKWHRKNAEGVLVTTSMTSLLMELIGVGA